MPDPITFTDGEGNEWTLQAVVADPWRNDVARAFRDATPADLSLAGYTPSAENVEVQRLCLEAAKRTRELEALRALEQHVRRSEGLASGGAIGGHTGALLKAIDEARK